MSHNILGVGPKFMESKYHPNILAKVRVKELCELQFVTARIPHYTISSKCFCLKEAEAFPWNYG